LQGRKDSKRGGWGDDHKGRGGRDSVVGKSKKIAGEVERRRAGEKNQER